MDRHHTIRFPARIPRQHEVGPAGQRLADGLIGLAAHQHRLAQGDRLEMFQILGQAAPRQAIVATDDAVARHGHDERDINGGPAGFISRRPC